MKLLASGFWFGVVGAVAAATHALVFAATRQAMWPELANALGFAVAFSVSFFGHGRLSFRDHQVTGWTRLRRFGATALLGFAVNELIFIVLLRLMHWRPWPALIGAMVVAALLTFVLGRFWAFRR